MRKKLQELLEKYGPVAAVTYFAIFFLVLGGAALAIRFGFKPDGVAANVGIWTAAYLFTKVTQPLRIAGTLALTPILGRLVDRIRGKPSVRPPSAPPPPSSSSTP